MLKLTMRYRNCSAIHKVIMYKARRIILGNCANFIAKQKRMVLILKKGASRKEMTSLEQKLKKKEGVDVIRHCGKIKLKEDPLAIQKRMRDEWQ